MKKFSSKLISLLFYISLVFTIFYGFQYGKEQWAVYQNKQQQNKLELIASEVDFEGDVKIDYPRINLAAVKNELGEEAKSWLYVPGTNINEVVMQADNNEKYLTTDVYGNWSHLGSIFYDENSNPDLSDPVSYIFGHHTDTGDKMTELKLFFDADFYAKNRYFFIYQDNAVYKYEIIGRFNTKPVTPIYPYKKFTKDDFEKYKQEFINIGIDREPVSQLTENDKLMLLITCENFNDDSERKTVVGKLIEVYND